MCFLQKPSEMKERLTTTCRLRRPLTATRASRPPWRRSFPVWVCQSSPGPSGRLTLRTARPLSSWSGTRETASLRWKCRLRPCLLSVPLVASGAALWPTSPTASTTLQQISSTKVHTSLDLRFSERCLVLAGVACRIARAPEPPASTTGAFNAPKGQLRAGGRYTAPAGHSEPLPCGAYHQVKCTSFRL